MPLVGAIWDLPDDPDGNVQHIAEHGLHGADELVQCRAVCGNVLRDFRP